MIPLFKVLMAPEASAHVASVLRSGHIAQGPIVDKFENELAKALGSNRPVTVNSGTSAIHLALVLAGVRPGDDVAVTPMTCAATILPILHLGARPLWIDVDERTGLMDPNSLDWRLTKNTSAIVAVDWAGVACDYDRIHAAADGIPVIEDAAHAFMARDTGRDASIAQLPEHHAHFVCYSFQAIKHLTTGDGGALIAPLEHSARAARLRWFGFDRTSSKDFRCAQDLDEAGFKFHMNDIAASIGLANLPHAIEAVETHRKHAQRYYEALTCLAPRVLAQPWHWGASWWIYTLLVDDRDKFQAFMRERGVETSQVHRRNDEHPVFKRAAGWHRELTGLNAFASRQVNIPVGWWLTNQGVEHVIDAVTDYAKS